MTRYRVFVLLALLFVVSTVGLIAGRVFLESKKYYKRGSESLSEGDLYMAIVYFGRAAEWYFPGNPYVAKSLRGLWETAEQGEANGELKPALRACYTLRGALYGTKGLFMPYKQWLEPCNEKIANLTVAQNPSVKRERVLSDLHRRVGPRGGWAAMVLLGFWGWVGGTVCFIWFSFDSSGKMAGRKAVFLGGTTLGFFVLWIFSMLRA